MTTVSIIIPAYNEERTIIQILERIAEQRVDGVAFEVVVIDDGSKDRTVELLEARPELYSHLVRMPKNGGKGAAVKAGLRQASGDYILFQDADLEYDPADYAKMLVPVQRFDADVIMGSRTIAPPFTRVYYFWHKVGNRFITLMFNLLYNMTFTDIYSCYLMYRRTLVDPDELRSEGWEQHAEILTDAVRRGKVVYEVPISYHGRSYEEGKKIRAHHVISVIWMIMRQRFRT
ncbi:MAG: glycosyltransferase family 2 protein [Hyphomicrobiales bacterium]|nr:glycosyltransferase family 2 protein [Hyphomicrobiales bacterium]MCP5370518.1 glycosyltransferase family 2 protein [Hyphomicrobiales bacterium]